MQALPVNEDILAECVAGATPRAHVGQISENTLNAALRRLGYRRSIDRGFHAVVCPVL